MKINGNTKYGAIFDMDGVLVESHDISWGSFTEVMGREGVELSTEDIQGALGKSLRDSIEDWNRKYGLSLELHKFGPAAWEIQKRELEKIHPDSRLITLLDDLKSHKIPMAVGTNSAGYRAEAIVELLGLQSYFPTIVSASDVEYHKPHPDLFLKAASRIKIAPKKCVVIEDAFDGIEAAKRGNMIAIGYLNAHNTREDLRNADLIITDFSEVSYERIRELVN
ncbi:MAG: HAD family phosphatase [archaeon]